MAIIAVTTRPKEIQEFLLTFGLEKNGGKPVFYPVWPYGERVNQ